MGRWSRWGLVALAVFLVVPVLAGCGGNPRGASVPGNTLTIYASAPLTGVDAAMGHDVVNGEKLALAQSGGTAGKYAINFSLLDSADAKSGIWTAPTVAANARKASEDKAAIAYLGEVEPSASAVSVIFLNEAQTLQVSPTDTFAGLTEPEGDAAGEPAKYYPAGQRTFARMVPSDDVQAAALRDWMRGMGLHRLSVVYDNALYGRGLAQELATSAQKAGLTLAGKPVVARQKEKTAKVVAAVRAERPDAIFYGGVPTDRPSPDAIWNELVEAMPRAQIFAPGALATPAVAAGAGAASSRLHLSSPALPMAAYGAPGRRFARSFQERYGAAPGPWAIFGYEAMSATIAAIRAAGPQAKQRGAVIRAFFHIHDRSSVLGTYSIERSGETTRTALAGYGVRNGRLVFDHMLQTAG